MRRLPGHSVDLATATPPGTSAAGRLSPFSTRYLLDTNILLAYARGGDLFRKTEARYSLLSLAAGTGVPSGTPLRVPLVSLVSVGEVLTFALVRHWGAKKTADLGALLASLAIVPVARFDLAQRYAEIDAHCRRTGTPLGSKNDLWIAATASLTTATLLTTDKDFDPLDGVFLRREWIDPG
jgi:predicted nucleic acid-binding protein